MANLHYRNVKDCTLSDYISAYRFRTVLSEMRGIPCGITEIPVEITVKKETAALLPFTVPWDGQLYGYVNGKADLQKALGAETEPVRASIMDWDTFFLVVFETRDNKEYALRVSREDVVSLLKHCRRVPEQRR